LAGFLPGLMITVIWSVYVSIVCKKNNFGHTVTCSFKEILHTIKDSFFALLFPIIVLGGIYGGLTTPTEAAAISLVYVLFVEIFVYKNIKNISTLNNILGNAAIQSGALTMILASAQVFVWFMTTQQIPALIYGSIGSLITSKAILIILLILIFFIMGCFIDVASVVIILGPLLIITLNAFDVDLIHFGIIAIVMSQVGFITPPFGLCLFVAMQVSKQSMGEVVKHSLPFFVLLLLAALIISFVPEISLFLPNMLMD